MANGTPRPIPIIYNDLTFSRKKKNAFRRENVIAPRSPVKSAPPVSRIFRNRKPSTPGAAAVSFRQAHINGDVGVQSPLYKTYEQSYFDQCFTKLGDLGSGSFGKVVKVQCKEDGKMYAVKKSCERFRSDYDRKQRLEEVNKNEKIGYHPNSVTFYKAWEESGYLYIQSELCEMSLKDYSENLQVVEENEIWNIIVDLLQGLKHLHRSELAHMDIKPANLFLGRDGRYKIGDFGLVVELTRDLSDAMDGDSKYMAPELMFGQFTKAADIYSLGITLLELSCSLDLPQGGPLWHRLRRDELPLEFTQGLSDDLIELITCMMKSDPTKRPTIDDILDMASVTRAIKKRQKMTMVEQVNSFLLFIFMVIFNFVCSFFPTRKSIKTDEVKSLPADKNITSFSPPLFSPQRDGHESLNSNLTDSHRNLDAYELDRVTPDTRFQSDSPIFRKPTPIFQSLTKSKDISILKASSPMWGTSPVTGRLNMSAFDSPRFHDCSPASAPVSDKVVRSRLFTCSSDEEDSFSSQKISKNLMRSFNENNEE